MQQGEDCLLSIENLSVRAGGHSPLDNINLQINTGQSWAITGGAGSGKTLLAKAIAGSVFHHGNIYRSNKLKAGALFVSQEHRFTNLSHTTDFYYQQRYNSQDAEDSLTAGEYLAQAVPGAGNNDPALQLLSWQEIQGKRLIQLSNGENKRLQLAIALLSKPALLIADNPYAGLDTATRGLLDKLFTAVADTGVTVILVSAPEHIPSFITHIAMLEKGRLIYAGEKKQFNPALPGMQTETPAAISFANLSAIPVPSFGAAVEMKDVTVRYGNRVILENINWKINKGECWALTGPNGSGKSTLLSLIAGDNPQAYANNIWLFDKKRGSGESIWDIKRHIGFVSPELHLYFDSSFTVYEVVASGLFDTIGLFRQLSEAQHRQTEDIIDLMQLRDMKQKYLHQLSRGSQRLALLARAFIKLPSLLILDEPCQGLDETVARSVRRLADELCRQRGTTLIYVSHYEHDFPSCIQHRLHLEQGKAVTPGL